VCLGFLRCVLGLCLDVWLMLEFGLAKPEVRPFGMSEDGSECLK